MAALENEISVRHGNILLLNRNVQIIRLLLFDGLINMQLYAVILLDVSVFI